MKRLSSILLVGLCSLLVTGAMFAEEGSIADHISVGARAEATEIRLAHEIARAEKAESKGVDDKKPSEKRDEASAESLQSKSMKNVSAKMFAKSLQYTTHPGAFHSPINISVFGDAIETEDGSIWAVAPNDSYIALNWFPTDLIVVTPNHSLFSSYYYRLTNQNTGGSIAVNLYLGPIYNGLYTHWIMAIDYYNNVVYLNDGSVWNMSFFDGSVVGKWLVNDTVIIGVNDGWLSSSSPNILINVNMLNYAAGAVTY